jgi:opacity protein-like surface antigen
LSNGVGLAPEVSAFWSKVSHFGGLAAGANFGRHLGVELAADFTEFTLTDDEFGSVAEYSVYAVMPLLRLRLPLWEGRVVPYLMAGGGITYAEFNDRKPAAFDIHVSGDGFHPALSVGGGVEYFFTRNFSLNLDTRWLYTWNHRLRVDDRRARGDFAALNVFLGFRVYLLEF